MRRGWKKVVSIMLAAGMLCSALAGCQGGAGSEGTANESSTENTGQAEAGAADGFTDYANGFPEEVTIQIPVYDRAFSNWNVTDNYYTNWIQEQMKEAYNVNVEFIAISKPNQVSDFMQLLAAGNAPDIIFHTDMPKELAYYNEGAFQELDLDEIAYYAPSYWENMSEIVETYGMIDGKHYFVFGNRPGSVEAVALIRQDWLDQVEMDMPQNLTELYDVLEAWQDAGLGHGGGLLEQNAFALYVPFRDWPISDEDMVLYSDVSVAPLTTPGMHDYLKNLNYQYNNGLMDKEFYLNIDETAIQQDFIAGNAGIMWRWTMQGSSTLFDSLLQNNPEAEVAIMPQAARTPEGNMPQLQGSQKFGMIHGINQETTQEERIAIWLYLEWMSQPENLFFLQNGVEGQNYTLNEDGLPAPVQGYDGESKLSENNNNDYWCVVTQNVKYEDIEMEKKAAMLNNVPNGYGYLAEQAYADYETRKEYVVRDPLFTTIITSVAEYQADLNEKWKELHVRCVMASEEAFEETYEQACQEYLNAGYQAVIDEKKAAFDEGKYIRGAQ